MWFRKKKIIEVDISEAIQSEFKKIQKESFELVNSMKLEIQSLKNECTIKQRVIDEQKEKLREQNEADIFLQCEKIKAKILAGEKKEEMTVDLQRLADLQRQQGDLLSQLGRSPFGIGAAARGLFG